MSGSEATLHLLRHAKAEGAGMAMTRAADHARPLAARGRNDAAALRDWLRAHGIAPELALVSTAVRTTETFELLHLSAAPPARVVRSEALYLAESEQLLSVLRAEAAARSILLVGHNPGLHELALHLAPGSAVLAEGLPTCTLASFRVDGPWSALGPDSATLLTIHRP